MSTSTTPAVTDPVPNSLEQKIEQAATEASQVASIFSPAVGQAIAAGVVVEPVIIGFIGVLINLFKHHTKQAAPPSAT